MSKRMFTCTFKSGSAHVPKGTTIQVATNSPSPGTGDIADVLEQQFGKKARVDADYYRWICKPNI